MNRSVDVLIHHMRGFAASQNAWEAGFAKSILKQSRRFGWRPTPKQTALMQRLVDELFNENECEVLEEFSPAEAGPCLSVGSEDGGDRHVQPTMGRNYRQRAVRTVEAQFPVHREQHRK